MLMLRSTTVSIVQRIVAGRTAPIACRGFAVKDDDAGSSDDEKDAGKKLKPKQQQMRETTQTAEQQEDSASARLNRLLASMTTDEGVQSRDVVMARPGEASRKRKQMAKEKGESQDIFTAAKRVAAILGEKNQQQTESELLAKLLGRSQSETDDANNDGKAVKQKTKTEAEMSLSELIVGMKIDRDTRPSPAQQSRSDFVRRSLTGRRLQQSESASWQQRQRQDFKKRQPVEYSGSVNLFGSEGMGVFKSPEQLRESPDILGTWEHLQKEHLKMLVTHPPANYFEKMALWTEHGRVWRFPINNEQDMNEEADVDFSDHIFLDQHLEPWCPEKGPIRHFMELVCVGLSKNPYITAREKKEHILWYRDYFENKKDMLKEFMKKEPNPQLRAAKAIPSKSKSNAA